MSDDVRSLEPKPVWNFFADLNAVPRPSKKEERVIQFAKEFGEGLGLETTVDHVGNVIVRKPATAGLEDRATVVMQSHLDMVCQKNADTEFDFDKQGIQMLVDGDWVRAKGTTLGADNGVGVASIMALLAADDIPHPPLEALFTVDEETGMTGAKGLKGGVLTGSIMLNLDTEDDDELTIGCAGGVDVTAARNYDGEKVPGDSQSFKVVVRGLKGGHSGMDIHKGRGNANKIMNRLLWKSARHVEARLAELNGGGLRNAIPRESSAVVVVAKSQATAFTNLIDDCANEIKAEYQTTDPEVVIECETCDAPSSLIPAALQRQLLAVVYACPCGIHRMSPEISDLVQTSNNLASVNVENGSLKICCLTRSSVNTERDDLANAILAAFELLDADATTSGDYPGWKPAPSSSIVALMSALYQEMFDEPAHVAACHAGLECGIVGTNYPDMEMISFGPNIRGAHSPDECVQITSVQKYWKFLLETLQRIPAAA